MNLASPITERGPDIRRFAADHSAPARARRHTARLLDAWGLSAVTDAAVLAVSELATNAARATTELLPSSIDREQRIVALRLSYTGRRLLIEVWDPSPHPPRRRDPGAAAEEGRGLLIVEALCDRWAYYRLPGAGGKITWCQIRVPDSAGEAVSSPSEPEPLPRRKQPAGALVPFQFSDDLEMLQRVADGLRALDWDLPDAGATT